jgi:hypothetical protein
METPTRRTAPIALSTLLAPIAWGTTYWVVTEMLPPDRGGGSGAAGQRYCRP